MQFDCIRKGIDRHWPHSNPICCCMHRKAKCECSQMWLWNRSIHFSWNVPLILDNIKLNMICNVTSTTFSTFIVQKRSLILINIVSMLNYLWSNIPSWHSKNIFCALKYIGKFKSLENIFTNYLTLTIVVQYHSVFNLDGSYEND